MTDIMMKIGSQQTSFNHHKLEKGASDELEYLAYKTWEAWIAKFNYDIMSVPVKWLGQDAKNT